MDIFQKIIDLRTAHRPAALVTVIATKGSVPRSAGAKMLVELDGTIHGTVGGSKVEALLIAEAQKCIAENKCRRSTHNLNDAEGTDTGMMCGGIMEFFIEPIVQGEKLYIFGAGHVALALTHFVDRLDFPYYVIDDRPEFANRDRFPGAIDCLVGNQGQIARELNCTSNDYIVIVTSGHKNDYNVLREVVHKPLRYLGLIASKRKRNEVFKQLQEQDGVHPDDLSRVYAPIGLEIGAETPQEIAISILAEMIKVRRSKRRPSTT